MSIRLFGLMICCIASLPLMACQPDAAPIEPNLSEDMMPPPQVEVFVKATGSGQGIISSMPYGISCGVTCTGRFPIGQPLTIVASPDFQSSFEGFRGACKGTTCTLTPDSTDLIDIYATFRQLACMPSSTTPCTVCNSYSSWVPGNGTATCGLDGIWGMCEKVTRSYGYVHHSDMIHNCGSINSDETWSCPMSTSLVYMYTPGKSLYKGKYSVSSPSMTMRSDKISGPALGYFLIYVYRNGSLVGSKQNTQYLYPRNDTTFSPVTIDNIEALDGCQNFQISITAGAYSGNFPVEIKSISKPSILPM